jgi:hypothetical protein
VNHYFGHAGFYRNGWNHGGWYNSFYYRPGARWYYYGAGYPSYYTWRWYTPYRFITVPVGSPDTTTIYQNMPYPILTFVPPTTADSDTVTSPPATPR